MPFALTCEGHFFMCFAIFFSGLLVNMCEMMGLILFIKFEFCNVHFGKYGIPFEKNFVLEWECSCFTRKIHSISPKNQIGMGLVEESCLPVKSSPWFP